MPIPVTLHIYDVSTDTRVGQINEYLEAIGTGAFHGGVEVAGKEWSYGYVPDGTGVFSGDPKSCSAHKYRESLDMGETDLSEEEIEVVLEELKGDWPGFEYDLLRRNCVLFSAEFVQRLGVGPVPSWVTNLAGAAATLQDGVMAAKEQANYMAIIAKAKAAEIDEQYQIGTTVKWGAKQFLDAAGRFDEEYKVREKAFAAQVSAQKKAAELAPDADADGDGIIDAEEAKAFLKTKFTSTTDALKAKYAALKKAVDKDGDGKITMEEAKSHVVEQANQCGCGCAQQ